MAPSSVTKKLSANSSCPGSHKVSKTVLAVSFMNRSAIITVKVGETQAEFAVHEDFLSHHSAVFRSMLRNTCKESQEKMIELPKTEVSIFNFFFDWMYSDKRLPNYLVVELDKDNGKRLALAKLWVFGDKYAAYDLQNATLDALRDSLNKRQAMPAPEVISYVYSNTVPGAGIRKLLVDYCIETRDIAKMMDPRVVEWDGEFCQEAFYHFATRFQDVGRDLDKAVDAFTQRDECEYHVHDTKDAVTQAAHNAVTEGRTVDAPITVDN